MNTKVVGVVPARLESKRLPGKVLADICISYDSSYLQKSVTIQNSR